MINNVFLAGVAPVKKWYRKTELTQFEQFDSSEEMQKKYKIIKDHSKYYIPTLEGLMKIYKGDWIATGANDEHWAVKDEVFQKTYKLVEEK